MCLAIPVQIKEIIDENTAVAEISGLKKTISTALLEDVKVGDYVILHVGYALQKIDPEEAQKTLALFASEASATGEPVCRRSSWRRIKPLPLSSTRK